MDCKIFEEGLPTYLYDEMPAEERAVWEAHAAACEDCRRILQRSRRMQRLLNERSSMEPTPDLLARCRLRLDEALDREQFGWRGLLRNWLQPFAGAHPSRAIAALTLVAFGFSVGWILRPRATAVVNKGKTGAISPPVNGADLGGARINSISQVAPDPQTGEVRITLNAERRVTMEGSLDDPHIRQVLVYAVKSYDNPGIRLDTLNALRQDSGDPSVRSALLYALGHDPNAGVRLEALRAVRKMDWCPEVQKTLLQAADSDKNLGVRDEAVDTLVSHLLASKDLDLVPEFARLAVSDSDRYVRMKSMAALRQLGQEPF